MAGRVANVRRWVRSASGGGLRRGGCRAALAAAWAAMIVLNAVGVRAASGVTSGHHGIVDVYTLVVDEATFGRAMLGNYGLLDVRRHDGRVHVAVGLTLVERDALRAAGLTPVLWRDGQGHTAAQMYSRQQDQGYKVYRSWDQPGGIKEELDALAAAHPDIAEKVVIGHSIQGREIVAVRVTKGGATVPQGSRPAVWFNALQHAREWIAIETNRRLLHHFVEQYGKDETVTRIVDASEIWFVVAANPDGYQFTFTQDQRFWRKNMHDNNGDGTIGQGDGVDPNRNFDAHWNYDNDGSSGNPASETYRGTGPASEPEIAAAQNLLKRIPFKFVINYHSAAELLLFPDGWQDLTPTADDPIYRALTGTRANPAVAGFDPILSSGLYITNGETCDYAHATTHALCMTPELSRPPTGNGTFDFPDDEALIQAEFEKNLPFALDIAKSAADPTQPISHLGNTVAPIRVDTFAVSYGDPQPVQANVLRRLGNPTMHYRINGGAPQAVPAAEWDGGERYGATGDVYYRRVRGQVSGAKPGDAVTVWFEAGGEQTDSFTYRLEQDTRRPVLVIAAEDYTGGDPDYPAKDGPRYLKAYTDALTRADVAFDVYDIDAHNRVSPSFLGVLSHYRGVVWYTGDDRAMHPQGWPEGESSRAQVDLMLAVRDFLNEGGKLLYSGTYAARPFLTFQGYNVAQPDQPCGQNNPGCEALQDDFAQYWLGIDDGGLVEPARGGHVVTEAAPFEGLALQLGGDGMTVDAVMQFDLTAARHPPADYPQFAARSAGHYADVGLGPRTGERLAYSGAPVDYEYERIQRTIDLSGHNTASLNFWEAHQVRANFEALIVEAHTVGMDDWTTLPDTGGRTSPNTALACGSAQWYALFPHLPHYMTRTGEGNMASCGPKGTTGEWNALGGTSAKWLPFTADLSAWSGKQVEVAITYVRSRRSQLNSYVVIDDVTVTADGETVSATSFEGDNGGWAFTGLPAGTPLADPSVNFTMAGREALAQDLDGAIVVAEKAITLGFGLQSITDEAARADLVKRALVHLGVDLDVPPEPTPGATPSPRPTAATRAGTIYLPALARHPGAALD